MATDPAFAATPLLGAALANATLDTSLTAPSNVATMFTAGSSGSRVESVLMQGVGTTASGVINLFAYDGSTYHLIDQFLVTAITSSTTALAWTSGFRTYRDLMLPTNAWSLRFTVTTSGLQSLIKGIAFGGSL